MKSFVKTRGILGMLVMGVGVLMVTAGCAVGGVDEAGRAVKEAAEKIPVDNIKNTVKGILDNKIYNIDDFGTVFKEGEKILEGDVEKTVLESEGVKKLRLDVGGCEVTFVPSEDEDFWVEAENVQKFQAYVDGEELHVINETITYYI